MKPPSRLWCLTSLLLSGVAVLHAGERLTVDGYAVPTSGGLLISVRATSSPAYAIPTAPLDRYFVPPGHVRWEVELTGARNTEGVPQATALRSVPDDYFWPSGEEFSSARFAGRSNRMNPFENPLDPLGVAPGAPPDYDQDGVPDHLDAFPSDPGESVDTDGDGVGNNADPDDDNDGIPDAWEISRSLNPLASNARLDSDLDGFTDLEEYEADTNPLSGGSRLKVNPSIPSPGMVRLSWTAMPGRSYSLWRLPALSLQPVIVAQDITGGPGNGPVTLSRDFPASSSRDFYFLKASIAPTP
ncbi:hypothetical protein [Luteolibacter soli]|uniref:Uncharacterized protein n=1 Tax=Luteolibacter soli TaxID=3135280 RepID=A0ABU9B2H0_9BACT